MSPGHLQCGGLPGQEQGPSVQELLTGHVCICDRTLLKELFLEGKVQVVWAIGRVGCNKDFRTLGCLGHIHVSLYLHLYMYINKCMYVLSQTFTYTLKLMAAMS